MHPQALALADIRDRSNRIDARRGRRAHSGHDGDRQNPVGAIALDLIAERVDPHGEPIVGGDLPQRLVSEADRDHRLVDR